jgi:hypothetical protein
MARTLFKNANEAYDYQLNKILIDGVDFDDTKALFNIGFTIKNPMDNHITNKERNWSLEYAEAEWEWYKSGDRSIDKLGQIYGKIPPIWEKMAYVTREEFGQAIDEIKAMIQDLGKKEEEMAEEVKEELSAQEPATEPLKHNPEEQIVQKFRKLSHNKKGTTTDLIFSKLFNK